MDSDERRLTQRNPIRVPIRLQSKNIIRWAETQTKDLGSRGLRCWMQGFKWPVDTEVEFEVPLLRGKPPIQGKARIAWIENLPRSDNYLAGLEFTTIDPDDLHSLHKFLKFKRGDDQKDFEDVPQPPDHIDDAVSNSADPIFPYSEDIRD